MFDKKDLQLKGQYEFPIRIEYFAMCKGMPLHVLIKLYEQAEKDVLKSENIKRIGDLPFGRGYALVGDVFEEKFRRYINNLK